MQLHAAFLASHVEEHDGAFDITGAGFGHIFHSGELPPGATATLWIVLVTDSGGDDVGNETAIQMETRDVEDNRLGGNRLVATVPGIVQIVPLGPVDITSLGVGYYTFRFWIEGHDQEVIVVPLEVRPVVQQG
jgi:hypothetical protein